MDPSPHPTDANNLSISSTCPSSPSSGFTTNFNWQEYADSKAFRGPKSERREACKASPPDVPGGSEFASFGLIDIKSHSSSRKTVPAVSIVITNPRDRSEELSETTGSKSMGSPPVTTTCPIRRVASRKSLPARSHTDDTISSTESTGPSGAQDAYGVSHQTHRRLQPLTRTKTEGTPAQMPSPWMLEKISAMRRLGTRVIIPVSGFLYNADMTTREKCAHLLRKFGLGVTMVELDHCEKLGVKGTIDWLIEYEKTPEEVNLRPWNFAYDKPEEPNMDPSRFSAWWALRMATTTRPLEHNLMLFWHNHFAVSGSKINFGTMMVGYLDAIQEHASGNFRTLLGAMATDPAMIRWLDTDTNIKGRPNENWARELMELFTLGIGNYTEKDIQEATRAFTGWSVRNALAVQGRLTQHQQLQLAIEDERPIIVFTDSPALHDQKPKTILGKTANFDAEGVMDHLVSHPAHAKFLMRKLWGYFVYPDPEPKVVDAMAKVYVGAKYEIKPVLRWMANAPEFWSNKAMRSLVKSPAHYSVPIVRQLDLRTRLRDAGVLGQVGLLPQDRRSYSAGTGLAAIMRRQGMFLFYPPDVAGWSWDSAWITTASILERNKVGTYLFTVGSGSPAWISAKLKERAPVDSATVVDLLVEWFDVPANPEAKDLMAQALEKAGGLGAFGKPNTASTALQAFWRLAVAVPEYQMR